MLRPEDRGETSRLGSVARVSGQPGLQVAGAGEIEQNFRQLLQTRQGQGGAAFLVGRLKAAETSNQLTDGDSGGLLLPTSLPAFLAAFFPTFLKDHLNRTGLAQRLQGHANEIQSKTDSRAFRIEMRLLSEGIEAHPVHRFHKTVQGTKDAREAAGAG